MSVYVKTVPENDWHVISKYLDGEMDYVLIPESVVDQLPKEQQERLKILMEDTLEYKFGGHADFWVDLVRSPKSWFVEEYLSDEYFSQEEEH